MMMNGTDVASLQPVSKNVKSPPTHGLTPTGVMLIDRTSCKARKRPRNASLSSPAKYSPNSSSSPSRITKANKSKRYGPRSSLPSSSSSPLARSSIWKRESTAADVAAAVSSLSPTATRDEPDAFRHDFPGTKWENPQPLNPHSYGGELIVSESRDHFALSSSTLVQTLAPTAYSWPPSNDSGPVVFSNLPFTMCHQPVSYLTTDENMPRENSSRNCLVGFSGITTHPYSTYPSHPSLELVNPPNLIVENPSFLGDDTSRPVLRSFEPDPPSLARSEENSMEDIQHGWYIMNREQPVKQQPIEDDNYAVYNGPVQAPDFYGEEASALPEESTWEYIGPEIVDEIAAEESGPSSQPERRPRSHLTGEARTKTSKTRKLKCDADPENEENDCLSCRKINLDSKKVIHRLPCLRWKLAEVILFRDGGLGLTQRWTGVKMKDLAPRDWVGDRVRTITVTIGCRKAPLELSVRKFTPNSTDVTWKCWVDGQGNKITFDVQPYALANIWETARMYQRYIYQNARIAMAEYADDTGHQVDMLVRKTYRAALDCHRNLICNSLQHKGDEVNHMQFLEQYICLWFAIRNTIGSAFIVGDDKLDMEPVNNEACPYHGKVFIPRMIPAQFDSLGYEVVLTTLRKPVLEGLWKMMASKNPRDFFVIYLTVFMLLHEVSITSRDRLRHARENKCEQTRYDLGRFVERLQEGAKIILSHWHYYKRDVNNIMTDVESEKKKVVWGELNSTEANLLVETRKAYEEKAADQRLAPMLWEDDLYFVSQMFEEDWKPGETFVSRF
ncbi:hypothetical protein F4781DRAFT_429983 [Annulohypoxylon bovei var. microspora]|nr:hypothetical protein F4781DRAFT_429983 [Annulohypoxylon bovei var. microspora]